MLTALRYSVRIGSADREHDGQCVLSVPGGRESNHPCRHFLVDIDAPIRSRLTQTSRCSLSSRWIVPSIGRARRPGGSLQPTGLLVVSRQARRDEAVSLDATPTLHHPHDRGSQVVIADEATDAGKELKRLDWKVVPRSDVGRAKSGVCSGALTRSCSWLALHHPDPRLCTHVSHAWKWRRPTVSGRASRKK
jgi:hypothetical protein